jgi:hypothetical protein
MTIRQGQPMRARDVAAIPGRTLDKVAVSDGQSRIQFPNNLVLDARREPRISSYYVGVESIADGEYLNCVLFDWATETFGATAFQVLKPYILAASSWHGVTQTTLGDGVEITYDATDLDITYQRRATWDTTETEVQAITSPYFYHELILISRTSEGLLVDMNQAGRHWAATND